jgi:menaquinone-dependent protoporphyrinogen oxidase
MMKVVVAYGSRYGSTGEVAQAVAATLRESGVEAELMAARDVRSLDGWDGVVLGTPLYLGALHKDVRALLERQRDALAERPLAVFALGPIKADDGLDGSRDQLFSALAKAPCPTPVATGVFVGAYDPARLGFKDRMLTALPASPLHGEPAHDDRDWEAIRRWAADVGRLLQATPEGAARAGAA